MFREQDTVTRVQVTCSFGIIDASDVLFTQKQTKVLRCGGRAGCGHASGDRYRSARRRDRTSSRIRCALLPPTNRAVILAPPSRAMSAELEIIATCKGVWPTWSQRTDAFINSVKLLGYKSPMFAVDSGCDPALIDCLLMTAASPAETGQIRGCVCQAKVCIALEQMRAPDGTYFAAITAPTYLTISFTNCHEISMKPCSTCLNTVWPDFCLALHSLIFSLCISRLEQRQSVRSS